MKTLEDLELENRNLRMLLLAAVFSAPNHTLEIPYATLKRIDSYALQREESFERCSMIFKAKMEDV